MRPLMLRLTDEWWLKTVSLYSFAKRRCQASGHPRDGPTESGNRRRRSTNGGISTVSAIPGLYRRNIWQPPPNMRPGRTAHRHKADRGVFQILTGRLQHICCAVRYTGSFQEAIRNKRAFDRTPTFTEIRLRHMSTSQASWGLQHERTAVAERIMTASETWRQSQPMHGSRNTERCFQNHRTQTQISRTHLT